MSLDDFLELKEQIEKDNWDKFLQLKEKFIKEGLPENIAEYKATAELKPEILEKIKFVVENEEGLRDGITFFVDSQEEMELIGKFFPYNPHTKQVKNAKLLIELLRLLNE